MKQSRLQNVPPKDRGCLFPHEASQVETGCFATIEGAAFSNNQSQICVQKPTHFKQGAYSQSRCYFECAIEGAEIYQKLTKSQQCLPWTYLYQNIIQPGGNMRKKTALSPGCSISNKYFLQFYLTEMFATAMTPRYSESLLMGKTIKE